MPKQLKSKQLNLTLPEVKTPFSVEHVKLLNELLSTATVGNFVVSSTFAAAFRASGILYGTRSAHYQDHEALHKFVSLFSVASCCTYCQRNYTFSMLLGDSMRSCGKRPCVMNAMRDSF
jgi:hypothetical protein